ncbi:response regulator [Gramella sp. GC03-9]|uniref:Response regulator n=1 Tax=Christiangramia oceanisediminis TaxID=2920386 RepID=A0A9X2R8R9_9FLAO|nr:response regulator [Gramella oceanisediminis]MCP9200438.1 response regulator [Gramella oceanisediminis]
MARILIVDDDQTIGIMIQDILEFKGHNVVVTQQPATTKDQILQHDIELVLLDKLISGVDGTDVCSELRKDERFKDLPIIMMSALHNVDEICREAGATEFLSKPFDMDTLIAAIDSIVNGESQN